MLKQLIAIVKENLFSRARAEVEAFDQSALDVQQKAEQKRLGEHIAKMLRDAIRLNPVHVTRHYEFENVGSMWARVMPVTGLGYMVSVYVPDSRSTLGTQAFHVCSISIDVKRSFGHVIWKLNRVDGEESFELSKLEDILKKARSHIRDWRAFPRDTQVFHEK